MVELFWSIIWVVVCYLYAKDTKERYPDIDINPMNYIIGGLLFGVFSWLWCWDKKRSYEKYN